VSKKKSKTSKKKVSVPNLMSEIMNNDAVVASSLIGHNRVDQTEHESILAKNKILSDKNSELESIIDNYQIKFDATLAELDKAKDKIEQLMETFGKINNFLFKIFDFSVSLVFFCGIKRLQKILLVKCPVKIDEL
jgi:hypothetical protein